MLNRLSALTERRHCSPEAMYDRRFPENHSLRQTQGGIGILIPTDS
jgi:hypothetical protein